MINQERNGCFDAVVAAIQTLEVIFFYINMYVYVVFRILCYVCVVV